MECNQTILVETDTYTSSLCQVCGLVHLHDGIYSLGFTVPAIKEWGNQVLSIQYEHFCTYEAEFSYLSLYSYIHQYEFHFFKNQFEEFQQLIGQTLVLIQAYELIERS